MEKWYETIHGVGYGILITMLVVSEPKVQGAENPNVAFLDWSYNSSFLS